MWNVPVSLSRFLSADERLQVDALFAAILPGGGGAPGARDVGAADFLVRLLSLDASTVEDIPRWRATYRQGLALLDAAARGRFGTTLAELGVEPTTALLESLAGNAVSGAPPGFDQAGFFALLRSHCIEGCFADPRWGGNRGGAMWKWFGYLQQGK